MMSPAPMPPRRDKARPKGPGLARANGAAVWIVLALAAILPYLNTLTADFTYDDGGLIVENPQVAPGTPWHVALTTPYWPARDQTGLYRPVTAFTYRVQRSLWGVDPLPFHALNVLLHAGVCLLVFAVLRRLAPERPGWALAASLLFAVHPIHTEAVTNVVGRAELLAAGFGLAGYLLWLRPRGRGAAAAAGLCFGLAAASKESAAGWLLLLAVQRIWGICTRAPRPALKEALGRDAWVVLGMGAYLLARGLVLGTPLGVAQVSFVDNPLYGAPWATRVLTAAKVLWLGISRTLWPATLDPDYSYAAIPPVSSWLSPVTLLLIAWVALIPCALLARRRAPLPAWSLLLYAAMILPVSNLILPIGTIMAERLLYLPSLGLLGLLAWAASAAPRRLRPRLLLPALLALVLVLCAGRTWGRNRDWHSDATLFAKAARTQPRSAKVQVNLGSTLVQQGRLGAAEAAYRAAVAIHGDYPAAWNGLGHALLLQERYGEAEATFRETLKAHPQNRETLVRLGNLLLELDRPQEALALFDQAIALADGIADGWIGRASALFLLERYSDSAQAWERVQPLVSPGQDLRQHLAAAYLRAGERERGLALLRATVAAHPSDAGKMHALALALLEEAPSDEGLDLARRAAHAEPRREYLETWALYLAARGDCGAARAVVSSELAALLPPGERQALAERLARECGPAP
jgi:tetratricopeptide (TPR) repeat protein